MAKKGVRLPALETRVRPLPHLVFYWNAFFQLSTDRDSRMGIGPVPWTALDRYASRYRVDDEDEFDVLVRFVRAMDSVFIEDAARRSKPEK